jgi:hypothetical protein
MLSMGSQTQVDGRGINTTSPVLENRHIVLERSKSMDVAIDTRFTCPAERVFDDVGAGGQVLEALVDYTRRSVRRARAISACILPASYWSSSSIAANGLPGFHAQPWKAIVLLWGSKSRTTSS